MHFIPFGMGQHNLQPGRCKMRTHRLRIHRDLHRQFQQQMRSSIAQRKDDIIREARRNRWIDLHFAAWRNLQWDIQPIQRVLSLRHLQSNVRGAVATFVSSKLVRRGDDVCDSIPNHRPRKGNSLLHILRPVIGLGQDMSVHFDTAFAGETLQAGKLEVG